MQEDLLRNLQCRYYGGPLIDTQIAKTIVQACIELYRLYHRLIDTVSPQKTLDCSEKGRRSKKTCRCPFSFPFIKAGHIDLCCHQMPTVSTLYSPGLDQLLKTLESLPCSSHIMQSLYSLQKGNPRCSFRLQLHQSRSTSPSWRLRQPVPEFQRFYWQIHSMVQPWDAAYADFMYAIENGPRAVNLLQAIKFHSEMASLLEVRIAIRLQCVDQTQRWQVPQINL